MDGRTARCRYEPSLDELLSDEMMTPVLRSAGFDPQALKAMLVETARRIENRERRGEAGEEILLPFATGISQTGTPPSLLGLAPSARSPSS